MKRASTKNVPARFNVGDRVRVKDLPNLFYTRTQMYVRGVTGTIASRTYVDLIPEDEVWGEARRHLEGLGARRHAGLRCPAAIPDGTRARQ